MHQTLTIGLPNSISPYVLSLREGSRDGSMKRLGRFKLDYREAEVCRGREARLMKGVSPFSATTSSRRGSVRANAL